MSRSHTPALAKHLAGRAHTRCTMLLLLLRDGSRIGITDHDRDIDFDLDGMGTVTYRARTGTVISDIVLSAGLETDNFEVSGPLTSLITLQSILGGRIDRAEAFAFVINWKAPEDGPSRLIKGSVSEPRIEGGSFTLEVRSDKDRFNQVVGRTITNNCDADYGDARCKAVPESVVGTVTGATSALEFDVSYAPAHADGYFDAGTVEAQDGALAGTLPVEVFSWTEAGHIVLFLPLVDVPAIGTTFLIKRGCGKSRADCMARGNIVNFRGFPEVPGSDQVLRATVPGEGS